MPVATSTEYDTSTGLVTATVDANGQRTTFAYGDDPLNRITQVVSAAGDLAARSQSTYAYDDSARTVTVTSDLNSYGDNLLKVVKLYDGMGRTSETQAYEGPTNYIATRQEYDEMGRAYKTSNPFRPQTETVAWTTSEFDALGRVKSVTTPDSAVITTNFEGYTVTVIDQAGKKRRTVTDGLGRLIRVDEPDANGNLDVNGAPAQSTIYSYDALDSLTLVSQGAQTRTFVYDSLKRLTSATNPESGLTCYGTVISGQCQANGYDAHGNLVFKTDARLVQSSYAYDAINRNTSVTYTNDPASTPTVTRSYDGATNGKGLIWKTETGGNKGSRTTINSYDPAGRPASQSQQFYNGGTWSVAYPMAATYDRAGHVLTQTYPSGHTVNYAYDSAGRNSSFTGNLGEGVLRTYANEFQYTAIGGLQQERFGTDTPLYHKQRFNQRGQLWDMRLSTVSFASDPANGDRGAIVNYYSDNFAQGGSNAYNNGNLLRQEIYIPGSSFFRQNYSYDSLNRLKSVAEKLNGSGNDTFKQAYTFDRWGNRTIDQINTTTNVPRTEFTVNSNNQLMPPIGYPATLEYDAAGNQVRDPYTSGNVEGERTFDAENRIIAADFNGEKETSKAYFTYDGDGQRVRRDVAGYEVWQVYGFSGELVAEYPQTGPSLVVAQPQKEYGYRNGELLVTAEPWANIAWNQPATQTNNFSQGTTAAKAVNGDVDGVLLNGSVAATSFNVANAWWQVDLQSVQDISSITVWGRTDCCPEQTSDFYVFVSNNAFNSTNLNATINQSGVTNYHQQWFAGPSATTGPTSISVNRTGRYVRVQLAGTPRPLALAEVQVWSAAAKLEWLVADHLGTPRMVVDKTGSLAGVSRHDYLPFGEELSVGRSATPGYSAADGVRQKFTLKERDIETGLDYFGARYYASTQGRFSSPDPLLSSGIQEDPQTWNRYSYTLNNPLGLIDPTGLYVFDSSVSATQRDQFRAGLAQAKANLDKIAAVYGPDSREYQKAKRAVDSYGAEGVKNGVTIFAAEGEDGTTQVAGVAGAKTKENPTGQNIHVTFSKDTFNDKFLSGGIAHEGSHVADGSDWVKSGFAANKNPRHYQLEVDGYIVQSLMAEANGPNGSSSVSMPYFKQRGKNPYLPEKMPIWKSEWEGADRATLAAFRGNVDRFLSRPKKAGGYGLTPTSTKPAFIKGSAFPR